MKSYLDTLRNLQQDATNDNLINKTSSFCSYEDYLHQNKIRKVQTFDYRY